MHTLAVQLGVTMHLVKKHSGKVINEKQKEIIDFSENGKHTFQKYSQIQ